MTAELIVTMPIVVGLIFAMIEIGMVLVAQQQIENAARIGCRVGALPADDPGEVDPSTQRPLHEIAVENAVKRALSNKRLIEGVHVQFDKGFNTGDPVRVKITLPMNVAAPDMLAFLGFSLQGHTLKAECVMRRE